MSPTASFQCVWETLRCSIYDHKNKQLLNFHIITPQILTCKAPNRFQESLQCKVFYSNKTFEESSKNRGVFRTQASIYDGAFL